MDTVTGVALFILWPMPAIDELREHWQFIPPSSCHCEANYNIAAKFVADLEPQVAWGGWWATQAEPVLEEAKRRKAIWYAAWAIHGNTPWGGWDWPQNQMMRKAWWTQELRRLAGDAAYYSGALPGPLP